MNSVMDWIRALVAPITVTALIGGALMLPLSSWAVRDERVRADVQQGFREAAAAPLESAVQYIDGTSSSASDEVQNQINQRKSRISSGMRGWTLRVFAMALLAALLWSVSAMIQQSRVFGPGGQRSMLVGWIIGGIGYVALSGLNFGLYLFQLELTQWMYLGDYVGAAMTVGVLGFFAYWIATALAASPVMKPSVPFGTLAPF
jgi:hypothetical protein